MPPIGMSLPTALTTSGNGWATAGCSTGGSSGASPVRSTGLTMRVCRVLLMTDGARNARLYDSVTA